MAGSSVAISDKGETIIIGNPLADLNEGTKNSGSVTVLRKVADDNSSEDMFVVADTINNSQEQVVNSLVPTLQLIQMVLHLRLQVLVVPTELQTFHDTKTLLHMMQNITVC